VQRIDVEMTPPQPPEVEAAVAELLRADGQTPDAHSPSAWWSDGLQDSL